MITLYPSCRICTSKRMVNAVTIDAPLINRFPEKDADPSTIPRCPIEVDICADCGLAQLRQSVSPDLLYSEYWYESGINERMREELATIALSATRYAELFDGDAVLDIGANDGTLLQMYPSNIHKVGVDVCPQFLDVLCKICDSAVCGVFPANAKHIPMFPYKVITTIAMFNHLNDPVETANEIRRLLHPRGVWICQFQDFASQVTDGVWDNFVHEHVTYPTLTDMLHVAHKAGLQVFDVESTPINGGSLRLYIGHPNAHPVRPAVQDQAAREFFTFTSPTCLSDFRHRIHHNISQIRYFVEAITDEGKIVDLYGASTKGNTLLQATGISQMVRAAWERNPRKYGRTTVTGVPIIDEALGRAEPPDTLLATIWQFRHQIIDRERETLRTVRMILPLPEATLIDRLQPELSLGES